MLITKLILRRKIIFCDEVKRTDAVCIMHNRVIWDVLLVSFPQNCKLHPSRCLKAKQHTCRIIRLDFPSHMVNTEYALLYPQKHYLADEVKSQWTTEGSSLCIFGDNTMSRLISVRVTYAPSRTNGVTNSATIKILQ